MSRLIRMGLQIPSFTYPGVPDAELFERVAAIAGTDTNIGHATVEQRDGDVSLIKLEVEVKDRKHLARVVRTIRQMPEIIRVSRYLASKGNQQE